MNFMPFLRSNRSRRTALMIWHIVFEAIDHLPATLSRSILTDLLRHEFGFGAWAFHRCTRDAPSPTSTASAKQRSCQSGRCRCYHWVHGNADRSRRTPGTQQVDLNQKQISGDGTRDLSISAYALSMPSRTNCHRLPSRRVHQWTSCLKLHGAA